MSVGKDRKPEQGGKPPNGSISIAEIIQVLDRYRDSVKSSRKKMAELAPTRDRIAVITEYDREVQALEAAMTILRQLPDEEHGTNADRIRVMNDQELVEFLERISVGGEEPWETAFAAGFCGCCPTVDAVDDDGRHYSLNECDFADGVCPHGDSIQWWLGQPAGE